jgi:predicted esterase
VVPDVDECWSATRHAGDMSTRVAPTLVLLHGHGGSPATFDGLARQRSVVAPVALHVDRGHVSWWASEAEGPTAADLRNVDLPPGPIIIGGFSQGAAMAAALAACRTEVVGLVVVAGFLPDPAPQLARPIDTLCIHSVYDETIDPFLGARVARWAKAAGSRVTLREYEGGHDWTTSVDEHVLAWVDVTEFDGQ